jgi:hypothetical protein
MTSNALRVTQELFGKTARAWIDLTTIGKIAVSAIVLIFLAAVLLAVGSFMEGRRKSAPVPEAIAPADPDPAMRMGAAEAAARTEELRIKCVENIKPIADAAKREMKAGRPEKAVLLLIECNNSLQDPEAIQLLAEAKEKSEQKANRLRAMAERKQRDR